jgi:hypothetical protein
MMMVLKSSENHKLTQNLNPKIHLKLKILLVTLNNIFKGQTINLNQDKNRIYRKKLFKENLIIKKMKMTNLKKC